MKKEISLTKRPDKLARYETAQYLAACGNISWYDFVTAMPSLVFIVTGGKQNGKENACLQSWSTLPEVELTTLYVLWEKYIMAVICINR